MSRINVDASGLADPRFARMAHRLGLADGDHARGKMEHLWYTCLCRQSYALHPEEVALKLGFAIGDAERVACALVDVGLARRTADHELYICGTKGRIEWLATRREAGKKGGISSGKVRKQTAKQKPSCASTNGEAKAKHRTNPPTPAPTPAPTLDPPITPPRGEPAASEARRKPARPKREASEVTREVIGKFNKAFDRQLDPGGWEPSVAKLLGKGYRPKQILAVVWWAAEEWADDPTWNRSISPKTLFKLVSSHGNRTFPEYLSCAAELWRELHHGEIPPWEKIEPPPMPQLLLDAARARGEA